MKTRKLFLETKDVHDQLESHFALKESLTKEKLDKFLRVTAGARATFAVHLESAEKKLGLQV